MAVPFLSVLCSSVTVFFLVSQIFAPRLTASYHLSLSCTKYSRQLRATPKDFMETFSVSLKCFFWPPWERLSRDSSCWAVFSGDSYLSCGQRDWPNEAVVASRGYRCWEDWWVGWLVGFYGISNFVGHLMPNPFYTNKQFYFKQFSLAWVHNLIVKNISISSYSV